MKMSDHSTMGLFAGLRLLIFKLTSIRLGKFYDAEAENRQEYERLNKRVREIMKRKHLNKKEAKNG